MSSGGVSPACDPLSPLDTTIESTTDGATPFESLPLDVLCRILAWAGPPFAPYACVSRRLHEVLSSHHQFVWFLCIECEFALEHDFAAALALARRADAVQKKRWADAWNRNPDPLCGNRRGLRDLLRPPSAVRRRSNDGQSSVVPVTATTTTTTDHDALLLARTGRWFALYRFLPRWRSLEPLIGELRRVLAFYGARQPQLLGEALQHAIEDAARLEIALRDLAPPAAAAALGAAPEAMCSQIGGVARVPAACGDCYLVARICLAELPPTSELPRAGVLLVVCAKRDASGGAHGVRALFVRDERALLGDEATRLSCSKHAFPLRHLAFAATLSLPPAAHAATPSALRQSGAYADLCSVWREARTARGRHSMLGHVQSVDAARAAARQRECDEATLSVGRHASGGARECGRDVYGVCGQRALLTLESQQAGGPTFGTLSSCVVWVAGGVRQTSHGAQLKALLIEHTAELKVTIE